MKIKKLFVVVLIAMIITACGASKNNEPINAYNFDTKTQTEQNAYINKFMGRTNSSFSKFNLDALEKPQLPEDELKIKEEHINTMLIQCAEIIGLEKWEEEMKLKLSGRNYFNEKPFKIIYEESDEKPLAKGFRPKAQMHYLSNRMCKCVRYLYIKQHIGEKMWIGDMDYIYHIDNFEYSRILSSKEQQVEKLYEKIYLAVKAARLLRRMENSYYPKSFLREHADQSGLTAFIKKEEAKVKHPLKHNELAAQFFGSREAWLTSFHQYLETKISSNNALK